MPDTERDKLNDELRRLDRWQLEGVVWECVGALQFHRDAESVYRLVRGMVPAIRKEPEL